VALVPDFQIEVPAPPQAAKGGVGGPPARVYRITSPQAEFTVSFKVTPETATEPMRFSGHVEDFDPGPGSKVLAVNEDEDKAEPLTAFTGAFVSGILRTKLRGKPFDVPLNNVKLKGFAINSVYPLDPSGWLRVVLVPTKETSTVKPPTLNPSGPPVPASSTPTPTASTAPATRAASAP